LGGLTEAEAAARRIEGQDNTLLFKPPRTKQQIWHSNLYNIFNLSLVGMAMVQLLLGRPLDALISMGVMALNIGLNVGQEMLARRKLGDIERAARAQATVIREGEARSIDPAGLVQGDILIAGPGDYILVDGLVVGEGQITIDESMLTGKTEQQMKRAGDAVYAGSFCARGRAAYEAHQVGSQRLIVALTDKTQPAKETLTPLERLIDRVLRFLLVFVALFTIIALLVFFRLDGLIPVEMVMSATSVIFNIAPASLFFMIFVTYATATADLGKLGALVHRARSVESLAETTVLCFAQAGILTGLHVEVEMLAPPKNQEPLSETRLRQILGDYARTSSATNLLIRAMINSFPGDRRPFQDQASLLSVQGWSAITFDQPDLRGTYVLGDPEILESYLAAAQDTAVESEQPTAQEEPPWRRILLPVGRLFRRRGSEAAEQEEQAPGPESVARAGEKETPEAAEQAEPASEEGEPKTEKSGGLRGAFKRLAGRVPRLPIGKKEKPEEREQDETPQLEESVLLFAAYPEPVELHDEGNRVRLPGDLIPLCKLRYTERVRPELIETIRAFSQLGMEIKVFARGAPDRTQAILSQAGLGQEGDRPLCSFSGPDLAGLDRADWAGPGIGHAVFGDLSPQQAGDVVKALREEGQVVAVVGAEVSDLASMQQANLAITHRGSSQAALGVADIVVLEDSPQTLLRVLDKGQRIVNGLLDVLKMYLTQMFYLLFLVTVIGLFSQGFPYNSSQGTVISLATVSLPAVGLSLWAMAGILPSSSLAWLLGRFVGPAALTMGLAALAVYQILLHATGSVAYAQLGVTHTLVACGLVLVIFIKPPGRATFSGGVQLGDWRPTVLVVILWFVFLLITVIPLAQNLLKVGPLHAGDYGLVAGVTVIWGVVLWLAYRVLPLSLRWFGKGKQSRPEEAGAQLPEVRPSASR
jgi:magnesium-transporting ATPase (P-type)